MVTLLCTAGSTTFEASWCCVARRPCVSIQRGANTALKSDPRSPPGEGGSSPSNAFLGSPPPPPVVTALSKPPALPFHDPSSSPIAVLIRPSQPRARSVVAAGGARQRRIFQVLQSLCFFGLLHFVQFRCTVLHFRCTSLHFRCPLLHFRQISGTPVHLRYISVAPPLHFRRTSATCCCTCIPIPLHFRSSSSHLATLPLCYVTLPSLCTLPHFRHGIAATH